jgi:hypothetical protein
LLEVSHRRKSVGTKLKQTKLSGESTLAHEAFTAKCGELYDLDIEASIWTAYEILRLEGYIAAGRPRLASLSMVS